MDMMQLDLFAFAAVQAKKEIETASRMDESIPKINAKHTPVILRNFLNDGKSPMPTTRIERIESNLKAIRLLKTLAGTERALTRDEQAMLSQFSGWGGLTEVFMESSRYFQDVRNCFPTRNIRRRRVPFSTVITRPNISLISCGTSSGRN